MACNMSHVKVIQYAKDKGWDNVCIFEDDVDFYHNFKDSLLSAMQELPDNWDMLYLSGTDAISPINYSQNLNKCRATYGAFGYLINSCAYDLLIEGVGSLIRPNDDFYAKMHPSINAFKLKRKNIAHLDGISDRMDKFVSYPHLK